MRRRLIRRFGSVARWPCRALLCLTLAPRPAFAGFKCTDSRGQEYLGSGPQCAQIYGADCTPINNSTDGYGSCVLTLVQGNAGSGSSGTATATAGTTTAVTVFDTSTEIQPPDDSGTGTAVSVGTKTATATSFGTQTSVKSSSGTRTSTTVSTSTITSSAGGVGQGPVFCQASAVAAMGSLLHLENGQRDQSLAEYQNAQTNVKRAGGLSYSCPLTEDGKAALRQGAAGQLAANFESSVGMARDEVLSYVHDLAGKGAAGTGTALEGLSDFISRVPDPDKQDELMAKLHGTPAEARNAPSHAPAVYDLKGKSWSSGEIALTPDQVAAMVAQYNASEAPAKPSTPTAFDLKLGASELEEGEIAQLRHLMSKLDRSGHASGEAGVASSEASIFELVHAGYVRSWAGLYRPKRKRIK